MILRSRVKRVFTEEGVVTSVTAAKMEDKGPPSLMGGAQTLSRARTPAVTRDPRAGSGAEGTARGAGWVWTLLRPRGQAPETPWAETGGTETKQTAPLKPPGTRVSGMSGFGLLSCSRIFKESKPFQAATPKQRAFCVAPSGLCFENKSPLLSGLDRVQGRQELLATMGAAQVLAEGSEGARQPGLEASQRLPRQGAPRPGARGGRRTAVPAGSRGAHVPARSPAASFPGTDTW